MISFAFDGYARVALRAAHDDPVGPFVDDAHVEVGVGLGVRQQRTIALHVGLRDRDGEIVLTAMVVVGARTTERLTVEHPQ